MTTAPQILPGLSAAAYNALDGRRSTEFKWFVTPGTKGETVYTPARCRALLDNPPEDKAAWARGRYTHSLGVDGDTDNYAIAECNRTAKVAFAKFCDEHPGRDCVSRAEVQQAEAVAMAVATNEWGGRCRRMVAPANRELSLVWTDEASGVLCKTRLDWIFPATDDLPDGVIVDLKTCQSALPRKFRYSVWEYGYDWQAALQNRGAVACGLTTREVEYRWLAVESAEPHMIGYWRFLVGELAAKDEELSRALCAYAECEASGDWPGMIGDLDGVVYLD